MAGRPHGHRQFLAGSALGGAERDADFERFFDGNEIVFGMEAPLLHFEDREALVGREPVGHVHIVGGRSVRLFRLELPLCGLGEIAFSVRQGRAQVACEQ